MSKSILGRAGARPLILLLPYSTSFFEKYKAYLPRGVEDCGNRGSVVRARKLIHLASRTRSGHNFLYQEASLENRWKKIVAVMPPVETGFTGSR
jgi:hypothetical protein